MSREAKQRAHDAFDILWKGGGMSRESAYKFLAARMGLSVEECHIAKFNEAQCERVIEICAPMAAVIKI